MSLDSVRLPDSLGWQCPLCGVPVSVARLAKAPTGVMGVVFDCCDNLVTLEAMRKVFGVDIPVPA